MWRHIEQKILQIRKATGVEIIILEDDKLIINVDTAITKKNNISKESESTGLERLDQLAEKLDPGTPLSLVLNGKGILLKKVPAQSANGTLQSILPNANPDDFYSEKFQGKNSNIISIVRKETVNKIISELKKSGYKVDSVSQGFTSINNILPFIKTVQGRQLESDSLMIELGNDNEVTDFRNKEKINNNKFQPNEYLIANQYVKPANLLSFSAAVGLLAGDIKSGSPINSHVLSEERKEYRYYKLFRAAGWSFLIALFVILLINFLFYTHFFNKNKSLETSRLFTSGQAQKFSVLEKEVRQKEKFIEQSGWTAPSRTSFYADRIAGLTPTDILLTSMQIYPARNNSFTEAGSNFFKKDTIMVAGVCENPVELNQFMNNLKVLPDFKDVTIKNYQYRNENESGSFLMEIITK